jgi:Peptidase S46
MKFPYPRAAALLLSILILVTLVPVNVLGDEGMFLPDTLSQLPLKKLNQRGLKIPLTDIFNPNGPSIKDAIVTLGFEAGYGTGEFVSQEGLVLTNHHVAFDALVAASDASKDYGANGYLAHNRSEELVARGYSVSITQELKDVTADVLKGVTDTMSPQERGATIQRNAATLRAASAKPAEGITASVVPINEGLSYYLVSYLVLHDVRIVYAPPKNIGFFGGDPDNFEWPRHDGDFTFMRAYVGPDGKPAEYSTNNVPFKPKKFMALSMGGVKENDFVMVMGFPASTRRYRESFSVAYNEDVLMPFMIKGFNKQIEALQNSGKNNRDLQVKLQSTIFGISNTEKDFEGSVVAMHRAGIVDQKRAEEAVFTKWVNENPERQKKYGEVLPSLQKAHEELVKAIPRDVLVQQIPTFSRLFETVAALRAVADARTQSGGQSNGNVEMVVQRARASLPQILAERNVAYEREMLAFYLREAADLPAAQKIDGIEKRFGSLQGDARVRAEEDFARAAVESKNFATVESISALFNMTADQLRQLNDPLVEFVGDTADLVDPAVSHIRNFNASVGRWRSLLVRGLSEMHRGLPYPDANRTLRFSYGEVKGYIPHDAAIYQPFTNLSGVIEKDTGREPFDVPERLKQLFRARDFGPYATADGQNVPVDFLSTADIIGGNSGSPIMNGRGEQVGIIFDGNYEGLGNDFFYDDAKNRAIAVDIRYVLFITDKFGGASYIFKELDIRNAPAAMKRAA